MTRLSSGYMCIGFEVSGQGPLVKMEGIGSQGFEMVNNLSLRKLWVLVHPFENTNPVVSCKMLPLGRVYTGGFGSVLFFRAALFACIRLDGLIPCSRFVCGLR
jgi:hypothetical protein